MAPGRKGDRVDEPILPELPQDQTPGMRPFIRRLSMAALGEGMFNSA